LPPVPVTACACDIKIEKRLALFLFSPYDKTMLISQIRTHPLRIVSAGYFLRRRFAGCLFVLIALAGFTACVPKNAPDESVVPAAAPSAPEHDVVAAARKGIGTPYRFGGASPLTGFDCSGLVLWSYGQIGIQLPRSAREQIRFGSPVQRREDLKPGDIVVFKGTRSRTGWHSGIYAGDGRFIHSPGSGKVVTESGMDEQYFARRFAGARRIPGGADGRALYSAYLERVKNSPATAAGTAVPAGKNKKKHPVRQTGTTGYAAHKIASARRHTAVSKPVAATKKQHKATVAAAGQARKAR
jgi:hypothetical protein